MGLETGTYIADLNPSNPLNSDLESQGAAHLRLIKAVLQNTFPHSSRSVGAPTMAIKSASYTILPTDVNTTFLVDTTAAVGSLNLTLPTLAGTDAGWEISVMKTNPGAVPVLIAPPSGTLSSGSITGLSSTRRCIPNVPSRVIWTGTAFICTRAHPDPIGAIIEFSGASLPVGFEWPNGQTLANASTVYPDFFKANGNSAITVDRRGYSAAGVDNMGGAAAGRIGTVVTDNGTIVGTTLQSVGGSTRHAQTVAEMAAHSHSNGTLGTDSQGAHSHNITATDLGHSHPVGDQNLAQGGATTASPNSSGGGHTTGTGTANITASADVQGSHAHNITGAIGSQGSGSSMSLMQPTIMMNFLLVVE